ncbi:MAG: hypothetical protein AB8G14_02170 [Ilumatobacter sp.]
MAQDATDPTVLARAAFETLVFAPIGLGAKLVEDAPAAVRRVRQELNNARFIGRLTVEQGSARLRERSNERPAQPTASGSDTPPDFDTGLPIAGYDDMAAIEIVSRLETLSPLERTVIAEHESANRRRRTVLGKISQLDAE